MSAPAATAAPASGRTTEMVAGLGILFILGLLVIPLPGALLDVFLALSLGVAIVVLLVALYTKQPLDFSSFPSLLLLLTLFRLALNVSSTRLILSEGHAGKIIQAFGMYVIGGNYVVGLTIFLILIAINFIVITKGAGRVAEVSARFKLDAMPGKQMTIDAEFTNGAITAEEKARRSSEVQREADFFGAMDGASKFVKGDAVAGLLITAINIVGGIIIGVAQKGLSFADSATQYTVLTVGDGLVTQIPALVISTAAGIMVTHAADGQHMGTTLASQVSAHPRALRLGAGVLLVFGLIPGLPKIPFLGMAAGMFLLARAAESAATERAGVAARDAAISAQVPPTVPDPLEDLLQIDPIELVIGYQLIPIADESQHGDLLARIQMLRKECALDLGILIPAVRVIDDLNLHPNEYVVRIRGAEKARGQCMPRFLLALDTGRVLGPIEGVDTRDPSFGLPAKWIAPARRADADAMGYTVVEPGTVIATHLIETLKGSAAELLGRQDVQAMLDALKKSHPALVSDVVPAKLGLGIVHRVLQRLLREHVPIRDMVTILEALADAAETTKDPELLTEHVRRALAEVIARQYMDGSGTIRAVALGPRLEQGLVSLLSPRAATPTNGPAPMTPETLATLLRELDAMVAVHGAGGQPVPLVVPGHLRIGVRRIVEPVLPHLRVISLAELPAHVQLHSVATWEALRVAA